MLYSSLSWRSSGVLSKKLLSPNSDSSHKKHSLEIHGHSSIPTLAASLSDLSFQSSLSHVVLVSSEKEAFRLKEDLFFFDPDISCNILKATDVSPYSGLSSSPGTAAERLHWLYLAEQNLAKNILIAPINAFLQKTIPQPLFKSTQSKWSVGNEIPGFAQELKKLGYIHSPSVEDIGQFSIRGGILDIYTPSYSLPVRIEFFGDEIDSIRFFNLDTQRSQNKIDSIDIIASREVLYDGDSLEETIQRFHKWRHPQASADWIKHQVRNLSQERTFPGFEFYLPVAYNKPGTPLDFIHPERCLWLFDPLSITRQADTLFSDLQIEQAQAPIETLQYPSHFFYSPYSEELLIKNHNTVLVTTVQVMSIQDSQTEGNPDSVSLRSRYPSELRNIHRENDNSPWQDKLSQKIVHWQEQGCFIFACISHHNQFERVQALFKQMGFLYKLVPKKDRHWNQWFEEQNQSEVPLIHILEGQISETLHNMDDKVVLIQEKDLLGRKALVNRQKEAHQSFQENASLLSFGDLKIGDSVVHIEHGIGLYHGLKMISIEGVENEFIELTYKKQDKLYVPTYRVGLLQKYSGPDKSVILDQLGGQKWQETKSKTQKHLKDLASELLSIYAKRAQITRPPFSALNQDYELFEKEFPYLETVDQQKAIGEIQEDLSKEQPMDRLLCGDVGFGKTEVAMRAAFRVAKDGKQVVILAPTTVLTFQHYETFKKRFKNWPFNIQLLNRFMSNKHIHKTINAINSGDVHILITTHKVFSSKIHFANLGLLVVDEEQKFGVAHKEKIRKLKNVIDTLAMSATPIPRTLNLSLSGLRSLSLINTAPLNRQPIRTFITRFEKETLRKAVLAEVARDGQVFFLHNRVQSINQVALELRELLPEIKIAVGHGQMDEKGLEKTILSFFKHEVDLLVCTTIIESGIDIPQANTLFIDNAHTFGLSQLYQLRGRVGRSHQKAYCYLLIPKDKTIEPLAQERLRIIQENTRFGSGLLIAQYDLELRGSGNILGQDQSGQVSSIGYELYMDLLKQEIQKLKGEELEENSFEPEINLRIAALIPNKYIPDIRTRLAYYKKLTQIRGEEDADTIEDEFKDRFGSIPEPVINLIGLMLIRSLCKKLYITDISSGKKNLSITFRRDTSIKSETILALVKKTSKQKKGSVTLVGSHKIAVQMDNMSWSSVYQKLPELFL